MNEHLQQIDRNYYRSVQLVIAHAELKQLSERRAGVERRSKIPLGMWPCPDSSHQVLGRTAIVESFSAEVPASG